MPKRNHNLGEVPDGRQFNIFTLQNANGMRIQVMDWGATWLSCQIPVNGELREVLLGCKPDDYPRQPVYLGASIGRYANRIANARFELDGQAYQLNSNQGKHCLHGGEQGFDRCRWKLVKYDQNFVTFSWRSLDGEQGFPGIVEVAVTYQLNDNNSVGIRYEATPTQDTPLNLTNHAYFNLQNANQGCDVRKHRLQLCAEAFLPVDEQGIPNAPLKSVVGTSFDFRQGKTLAQDFGKEEQQLTKGYDHAFLLQKTMQPVAILSSPSADVFLKIFTSQSALQVYTGNYLQGVPTREGGVYSDYAGIALETQALPDTPNHPEWWQYGGMSKGGEKYEAWTRFVFETND